MNVIVKSSTPLTAVDLKKVRDIMRTSQCPNESLKATFKERYSGLTRDGKSEVVKLDFQKEVNHTYDFEA